MHNDGRFDFHNAVRYSSDELANILTHCFENYIVRFVLDGPAFAARFGAEDLSLNDSLIVTHRQEPVAVALIARRGRHSRVAAHLTLGRAGNEIRYLLLQGFVPLANLIFNCGGERHSTLI